MKKIIVLISCMALFASGSGTPLNIDLPRKPKDGMGDVSRASDRRGTVPMGFGILERKMHQSH